MNYISHFKSYAFGLQKLCFQAPIAMLLKGKSIAIEKPFKKSTSQQGSEWRRNGCSRRGC